jgi:diguanylate cyclase (GGDEF)-like protein
MAEVEDNLIAAIRATTAERRGHRRRLAWLAAAGASYAVDATFLALFFVAGTLPVWVSVAYGTAALFFSAVFYAAIASGWSLRLRDPGLVAEQCVAGVLMQFAVAFAAPSVAFLWLANLFTVLAFSMVWLSVRASIAIWALCATLGAGLFFGTAARIWSPGGTTFQAALGWLYFSLVLGRCVLLSAYSGSMRARLGESRRKLAQSLEQIQELVSFDELTKAFNRRSMMARLEQERGAAERSGAPFAVAMLDLDHFKQVNDGLGHATGDAALKAFVKVVHATMRDTDVFCRYGGEEFLMLLVDADLAAAATAVERVRLAVAQHDWPAVAPGLALTVSAGIAGWRKGETLEPLLNRADAALYKAKRHGRNRVETS